MCKVAGPAVRYDETTTMMQRSALGLLHSRWHVRFEEVVFDNIQESLHHVEGMVGVGLGLGLKLGLGLRIKFMHTRGQDEE